MAYPMAYLKVENAGYLYLYWGSEKFSPFLWKKACITRHIEAMSQQDNEVVVQQQSQRMSLDGHAGEGEDWPIIRN